MPLATTAVSVVDDAEISAAGVPRTQRSYFPSRRRVNFVHPLTWIGILHFVYDIIQSKRHRTVNSPNRQLAAEQMTFGDKRSLDCSIFSEVSGIV